MVGCRVISFPMFFASSFSVVLAVIPCSDDASPNFAYSAQKKSNRSGGYLLGCQLPAAVEPKLQTVPEQFMLTLEGSSVPEFPYILNPKSSTPVLLGQSAEVIYPHRLLNSSGSAEIIFEDLAFLWIVGSGLRVFT